MTPYGDAEQIVSGALSFAIAAGLPFVSTPYRYANDLAAEGCGVTVAFGDDDALASLLLDDEQRRRMSRRAHALTATRSWPQIGRLLSELLEEVTHQRWATRSPSRVELFADSTVQRVRSA